MHRLRLILLLGAVVIGVPFTAYADDKVPPPATKPADPKETVAPQPDPKAVPKVEPKAAPEPAKTPAPMQPSNPVTPPAPVAAPKAVPSVIPVYEPSTGDGGAAGPTATVFTKNADAAFDRYVDLTLLGRAWDSMDAAVLTDVGLQLAEGERVLLRSHKAVTAAKVLDEALKAAVEKKDAATLDRLAKAADRVGNKDLGGKIAAAKLLGTASRSVHPALSIALDDITPAGLIKFQSVRDALQVARLKSDRTTIGELEKELAADKVIPAKQREFLTKQVEDIKKALPAAPDPQTELLNKLGAGSRGGDNILQKAGGVLSSNYKKTDAGKAGMDLQKQAQIERDKRAAQLAANEAAARKKAGELAAQAKIERDKRAAQLAANEAAARKKAGELAAQAKIERDKRLAQANQAAKDLDKSRLEAHDIGRQIPGQIVKNTIGNGPKPDPTRFTDPDVSQPTKPTNTNNTTKPTVKKPTSPGVIVDDPVKTKPVVRPPTPPTPTWPTKPNIPSNPSTPTVPTQPPPTEIELETIVQPPPGTTEPEEIDTWYTKELVIHNDTEETLQVYVRYYAPDDKDDYSWFPEDKDEKEQWAGPFIVKPGAKTLLKDGDEVIFANKCQIKATSKSSDTEWGVFDVDLVGEDGYQSKEMTRYTFRLFP